MNPVHHNMYDFRGVPGLTRMAEPSFARVVKPKSTLPAKLFSSSSLKSFTGVIESAQKMLRVYNEAAPIIKQAKPMIDNVRTTFKVAKAFKKFGGGNSLEQAFDNLPDYQDAKEEKENKKEPEIKNNNTEEVVVHQALKEENSVPAPFYPVL